MTETQETDLPDYQGCLNLLHAIYVLWWRDAQRSPRLLAQLADWTGQTTDQARSNRPASFRAARQGDLLED